AGDPTPHPGGCGSARSPVATGGVGLSTLHNAAQRRHRCLHPEAGFSGVDRGDDMSEETVVGWDGTAPAHQALEWALARAESRGENVLIARVGEESTMGPPGRRREAAIEAAEYSLDQARLLAQAKHPRLAVTGRLLLGDSVDELRSLTDEDTLLAVGTSASDQVASVDAWSVGARLAATSFGPVALVPDGSGARDDSRSGIVAG